MTKEEFMKSLMDFTFEVRPLVVNVAQMQFELQGKIKEVCPQPGCNFPKSVTICGKNCDKF